jgi:hypothetical protein
MRRILITCSRTWKDWELARRVLARMYELAPDAILVSGHNPRGDQDLERIWKALGGQAETYPADWSGPCARMCERGHRRSARGGGTYCPAAGDRRNRKMAHLPGVFCCLAFIGPCEKDPCYSGLAEPHPSHGASGCADYAEVNCGIRTRRFAAG